MSTFNELLTLLQIYEELFDGKLGTCKTDSLEFELKRIQSQYAHEHTQYRRYMKKNEKRRLNV